MKLKTQAFVKHDDITNHSLSHVLLECCVPKCVLSRHIEIIAFFFLLLERSSQASISSEEKILKFARRFFKESSVVVVAVSIFRVELFTWFCFKVLVFKRIDKHLEKLNNSVSYLISNRQYNGKTVSIIAQLSFTYVF